MKKCLAIIVALVLMLCATAFASELEGKTTEELIAMIEDLNQQLAEMKGQTVTEETSEAEETPAEPAQYTELARGAKGEEVKVLQQRLKDLGFLTGSVDGDFGGGTERAISAFQSQHELPVTGIADTAMQELLHSDAAEKAIVYEALEYKGVSRDPSKYTGRYVKFSGKVLQVIEYFDYDMVSFRIATSGNYDNVVYVTMEVPEEYSRILEDDRVEVSGTYGDLYSYETVRGDTVTIPLVYADLITLK